MHALNKTPVHILFIVVLLMTSWQLQAQEDDPLNRGNEITYDNQGRPIKKDTSNQTLQHRDPLADSITIFYHFFDSTRIVTIDSSISDFYQRYPVPYTYVDLGNFGNAARSILFNPVMQPGFDAGFHSYDVYRFRIEDTKIYQTTRPYVETAYLLGSRGEQMIDLFHTQNRKDNFNLVFDFRLINSPGILKNQNTNNNNLRFNTFYQSDNKRYSNYLIFINNKVQSSDNGGLQDDNALKNLSLNDPFEANTRLGSSVFTYRNIFSNIVTTGTEYKESIFLLRQSYDFGQKDSLVKDTVTYKLFYPRWRLQHTLQYSRSSYGFQDYQPSAEDYQNYYNYILTGDSIAFNDTWKNFTNDFSIISYPQKNNLNQYLKAGAGLEIIKGISGPYSTDYQNIYAAGEYRNRTRNQLWEILASGKLYVTGHFTGDYSAFISLKKALKNNGGALTLGFQNVNRTPSFVSSEFNSAFPSVPSGDYNKENIAKAFAEVDVPKIDLKLMGDYYLVTNYVYFDGFYQSKQASALFNVIHAAAQKKFALSKHINLYGELHLQQATANAPVNLPLIFTRNRIAFEGNFFKNLYLSTGLELRYSTAYDADGYSPLTNQFFLQDTATIRNRPDINLYLNMRIKSFKGFVRLENLNASEPSDGFKFIHYNFSAPHYATRGLWFRLGIWWNFVN